MTQKKSTVANSPVIEPQTDQPLFTSDSRVPLESVITTAQLRQRESRPADYEAENRALASLMREMASSSGNVLQKLVETALSLCGAHSAGISILEEENGRKIFRWHAVAGQWSGFLGGTMPREISPCGTVLDRNSALLMSQPERYYPIPSEVAPAIIEVLLIPFHVAGKPVGTIWVIAHDESRQFDEEDERLLKSLGKFAATAYQLITASHELKVQLAACLQSDRELQRAHDYAEAIIRTVPDPLLILTADLRVHRANEAFYRTFKVSPTDTEGRPVYDLGNGQWKLLRLRELLDDILPRNSFFNSFEVTHNFESLGQRTMLLNARRLNATDGQPVRILLGIQDVTQLLHFQAGMRRSEIRYRRLFEAARDGVLLMDPQTRKILDANPFMTELLGYKHTELLGKELFEIGLLKDKEASQAAFRELQEKGFIRYEDLPLENKTGERREVEFVSNLYVEDGAQIVQCNIRDITERKQAEAHLRASEERYRTLFESIDEGFCIIEKVAGEPLDFRYVEANPAFALHSGVRNVVGQTIRQAFPGEPEEWFLTYDTVRRTGAPIRFERGLVTQGRVLGLYAFRVEDEPHRRVAVIFKDITERKRVEEELQCTLDELELRVAERTCALAESNEQLRAEIAERKRTEEARQQLLRQLVNTQEEERRRISHELHDTLGQHITALNITLKMVQEMDGCPDEITDRINKMRGLTQRIDDEVERLSFELRPPALDDLGLADALRHHAQDWAAQSGIPVDLHAHGLDHGRLSAPIETTVYRVTQEALTNILKHAQASRVSLIVKRLREQVLMIAEDDGGGFDLEAVTRAPGAGRKLGLKSMAERAALVGGTLDIESAPGAGTTVYLRIPLEADSVAANLDQGGLLSHG